MNNCTNSENFTFSVHILSLQCHKHSLIFSISVKTVGNIVWKMQIQSEPPPPNIFLLIFWENTNGFCMNKIWKSTVYYEYTIMCMLQWGICGMFCGPFSTETASNGRMMDEFNFPWRDWGKPWKPQSGRQVSLWGFQPSTSRHKSRHILFFGVHFCLWKVWRDPERSIYLH